MQQTSIQRTSTLNPSAREWFPPGYLSRHSQEAQTAGASCDSSLQVKSALPFELSELPLEILSSVMAFLGSPQDLCSCLQASRQLQAAVGSARLSFELTGSARQRLSFPSQQGLLDELVHALTRYMPGMSSCNLSMLPLEHTHVSKLAQGLKLLQHLDLSGCKKLQPSMTQQLLQHLASKQLQALNLQRCFQLTDACLTGVLDYACGSHSSSKALQCVALSHLNLAAWPARGANDTSGANRATSTGLAGQMPASSASEASAADSSEPQSSGPQPTHLVTSTVTCSTEGQQPWYSLAAAALCKLPKQLGHPLLGTGSASALQVVVLNNCSLLSVAGLVSLAVACPQLEYLFLGGSTLKAPSQMTATADRTSGEAAGSNPGVYVPRTVAAAAAAAAGLSAPAAAASGSAQLPVALEQLSELLQLPTSLPWDALSSCCDASSCTSGCGGEPCTCSCSCCSSMRAKLQHCSSADRDEDEAAHERARKRLHRNEPSAAALTTAREHALSLAYVAALLPGLKAFEVSFMAPGIAGWLRVALDRLGGVRQRLQGEALRGAAASATLQHSSSSSSSNSSSIGKVGCGCVDDAIQLSSTGRPKVWQLSCLTSVVDALRSLDEVDRRYRASSSSSGAVADAEGHTLNPAGLAMAIRCAANCSNRGRSTPLHMAADAGCACHIRALLSAGAAVAARDASGASALFVACEAGQAAAVAALLEAGADALVGNTAGETPLYIAALRGHLRVVELLLGHLSAADVDWTQRQLYGDAWTPLMAAAVANRVNVAMCLLRAAATCCNSSKESAGASLSSKAVSRAGLGCGMQASAGCSAGSSCPGVMRLLAAENRYGQTVLHIAARKGCRELLQLLLLYGAGQVAGRVADAAGDTPMDIARRHGHEITVRELLQQC